MAGQLSIYIRACHGAEPESGSKRNTDGDATVNANVDGHVSQHVAPYFNPDGHPGCRQHAAPRLTGSHCDQADASARRGWDFARPTAGSGTPSASPPVPVAQPTNLQEAVITQPTQLASQSTAPIQSPTPALSGVMAQATSRIFTATQVAQPTAPPASATPAAIAKVSDSTPRPTSQPILGESQASTQSSPDQSVPAPSANAFGGLLAPLGGVAFLVIAVVVGGVLVARRRSG